MAGDARLLVSLPEEWAAEVLERKLPGIAVEFVHARSEGPWPAAEALWVGSLPREFPQWRSGSTPRLRFIQRMFTGLDEFPFDRIPPQVAVAGNVGGYAPFVAEHAVLLVLALLHDLETARTMVADGRLRPPPPNRYLTGQRVLLLGFGEIARELSVRVRALGARVDGLSRDGAARPGAERMFPASRLAEALSEADVVVDCRPLTRATRGTIDAAALGRMRPDAVFVNIGRAGTVDPEALYHHLRSHAEFRAGTDVWWDEEFGSGRLTTRYPFSELPNFLGTPHIAAMGREARQYAADRAVENLARFFSGAGPAHLSDRTEYV